MAALWLFLSLFSLSEATKHSFTTFHDGRTLIGPVGVPFGFLKGGCYQLNVFDFHLESPEGAAEAGFLLHRFENDASFQQYMEVLRADPTKCSFSEFASDLDSTDDVFTRVDDEFSNNGSIDSAEHGIFLSMATHKNGTAQIEYTFQPGEEGLYYLIYQVCPAHGRVHSSFELDFHFLNYDSMGNETYLTAGEMKLPLIFFFFAVSYLICFVTWFTNIRGIEKGGPGHFEAQGAKVYRIHHLMSVLLLVKFLSVFFESLRYHAIRVYGHAEVWSFLYYTFAFIKGTFLFTVLLLIGTGWSFVKPFLNEREKKMIMVVLGLQVINNIALTVLSQETEGESDYSKWSAILHLVDVLCCCAVLIPIVWQVNALEKSMGNEEVDEEEREMALETGEKGEILSKLQLFRSFYLLVVGYIYATRVIIYLFVSMLDYEHLWLQYFVVELITLSFYVVVGIMFRPMAENPYLSIKKNDDDEGIALT